MTESPDIGTGYSRLELWRACHFIQIKCGRGRFLNVADAGIHLEILEQVGKAGNTNASPKINNAIFHQLKLKNFLRSGEMLPSFFEGVTKTALEDFVVREPSELLIFFILKG